MYFQEKMSQWLNENIPQGKRSLALVLLGDMEYRPEVLAEKINHACGSTVSPETAKIGFSLYCMYYQEVSRSKQ